VKSPHLGCPFGDLIEGEGLELSLAAVRDLREHRPTSAEELEQLDVDVLAGFVLARASQG
jgi:hypothetical protein